MKLIRDIEELLALKGQNIAFFFGSIRPTHFGYLEFIRRCKAILPIEHLIFCPQKGDEENDFTELRQRLRIMDLVKDWPQQTSEIYAFSHELCHSSHNKVTFDDLLHVLKRRGKKIFVLLPCHADESYEGFFETKEITFVLAYSNRKKQVKTKKFQKNYKLIYMDDIKLCTPGLIRENISKKGAYLPETMDKYLVEHHLHQYNKTKNTFN